MTLLTIVQDIADAVSGPRPTTVVSNTNPEARTYLRIVNKVGIRLMKDYVWDILRKEHTFTSGGTETLVASASMPSDFDRFIPEAFWYRGNNKLISGPIGASEWQARKTFSYVGDVYKFTRRAGDILVSPVIDSGAECAFEYVSNLWCESSGGTGQTTFQADTDVPILDAELITLAATYAWLASEGLDAADAFQDFKGYFDTLRENEDASEDVPVVADIFARDSRFYSGSPPAAPWGYNQY